MVKHLDHLNLSVRNVDETAAWYSRVFGFSVVERGMDNGQPWCVLRCAEAMLCIYQHPELDKAPDSDALEAAGFHRVSHFGLRITDRDQWEETVRREGLEVRYGGAVDWPHSTAWYIKDPTGYEIEVALWDNDTVRFDPL